jgi:hypothetical protein
MSVADSHFGCHPPSSASGGRPEWALEVPLEEVIVIDIAGDPFKAERLKKPTQVRCNPGVDFGVGRGQQRKE